MFAANDGKTENAALPLAELAVHIHPTHPAGHIWAGCVLRNLVKFEEAETAFRRALALDPNQVTAMANLANVIFERDPDEAIALLYRALKMDRSSNFIMQSLMLATLSVGDYERGWNLYNQRFRYPNVAAQIVKYPDVIDGHNGHWDGYTAEVPDPDKPGAKKSAVVFLVGEEGIGERVLFASMIADVIAMGATPVIEMTSGFERFAPWFQRSFPQLRIAKGGEACAIDYHITIGDLGHMFRRKPAEFPKHRGYMTWDKARAAAFRRRLSPGPVIGICYKSCGNAGPLKSVGLDKLHGILDMPGATFVSLQYNDTPDERVADAPLLNKIQDLDMMRDMDGVAALIGACDLVITVSSITAHMAGAMGKPVWTFIPGRAGRMWFWGLKGSESPWYPSMTLYRQEWGGNWQPAIDRMTSDLRQFVGSYKGP